MWVKATVSEEDCRKYIQRNLDSNHYDNYKQIIRWAGNITSKGEAGNLGRVNFSVPVSFAKMHAFLPPRIWWQNFYQKTRLKVFQTERSRILLKSSKFNLTVLLVT